MITKFLFVLVKRRKENSFDGKEENNLAKFEIEHESVMHNIQTIGIKERMESLPGKTIVTIHVWVNGISNVLDKLHLTQGPQPGFQIIQKTIKGEAQMPTWSYYKITSTRERISSS